MPLFVVSLPENMQSCLHYGKNALISLTFCKAELSPSFLSCFKSLWVFLFWHYISSSKSRKTFSISRNSHLEVFYKKGVLENFVEFKGKHLRQGLFFNKKETLVQVFSCEFCEIFKNTFC